MAKISGKINRREREICARLKTFREAIKLSQPDFAAQVKISQDQLKSIEYGRTPLRYDIAWRVRIIFGLSLNWLAGGNFPPDWEHLDHMPMPSETGLKKTAFLSEVFDRFDNRIHKDKPLHPAKIEEDEALRRAEVYGVIRLNLLQWLASIPDETLSDFHDALNKWIHSFLQGIPAAHPALWQGRLDALVWSEMRWEIARRLAKNLEGDKIPIESSLTDIHGSVHSPQVRAQWPILKSRLQKATAGVGLKSRLAEFLGVTLTSVSQWLTNAKSAREPGAETTLRMLYWVEQQERKKT